MAIALLPFGFGKPRSPKVNRNRVSDVDWQFGLGMHLFRQFERDSGSKSAPKKSKSVFSRSARAASSDPQVVGGTSQCYKATHSRLCRRAPCCERTQRRSRASPDALHLEMILRPRRRAALRRVDRKRKLRRADSNPHGSGLQVPLGHRSSKASKTVSVREARRRTWFHRSVYARNWFPQFRNAENFKTRRQTVKKWSKKTYRQCVKEAKLFKGAVHQMRRNSPGSVCKPRLVAPGEWGKILFTLRHRKNRRSRRKGAVRKPVLNPLEHENAVINSVVTDEASSKGELLPPSLDDDGTLNVMPSPVLETTRIPTPPLGPITSECPDCEGTSCSDWIRNGCRVGCGF